MWSIRLKLHVPSLTSRLVISIIARVMLASVAADNDKRSSVIDGTGIEAISRRSRSMTSLPTSYLDTLRVIPVSLTDETVVASVKAAVGAYRIGFVAFSVLGSVLPGGVSCESGCAQPGSLAWEVEGGALPVCAGGNGPPWLPGTKDHVDWAMHGTFAITKITRFTATNPVILVDGTRVQLRLPNKNSPVSGLGLWDLCMGDCPDGGGGSFDQEIYNTLASMEPNVSFSVFGGDNAYSRMMSIDDRSNLPLLWKNGFGSAGTQEPIKFLTITPSLMLLGNHEYQAGTGCQGGCPWEAEAAPYVAFLLTSGYAPWWAAGVNVCKCTAAACQNVETYGGSAPPVDWRYTFGVYALGSVAIIAWDNRWSMSALLELDKEFQTAAGSSIDALAAIGMVDQVWFVSHWDAGNLGALEGVSESKQALQDFASKRLGRIVSWVGMAGHTHIAASVSNTCVTIGNNGKTNNGAAQASPSLLTFDPSSNTTTVTNAGDTPGGARFQWISRPGYAASVEYIMA